MKQSEFVIKCMNKIKKVKPEAYTCLKNKKFKYMEIPFSKRKKSMGWHLGHADYDKKGARITIVEGLPKFLKEYIIIHELIHMYHFLCLKTKTHPWYNRLIEEIRTYSIGTWIFIVANI